MLRVPVLVLLFCFLLGARAELVLPGLLTGLSTLTGQQLLLEAQYRSDFFALSEHFVTQINGAFCGPASSAVVLNALNVPRPLQDAVSLQNPNYSYYNQVNMFDASTELVVPQAQVLKEGMSISDLSVFLAAHQSVASAYVRTQPDVVSLQAFRTSLRAALGQLDVFVIVNFDRNVLGEMGGGHHSPVAAYHEATDTVLVLDVSRYKYAAWWVPVSALYDSTSETMDSSTNLTRGLVFVWTTARYGDTPPVLQGPTAVPQGSDNGQPQLVATVTHSSQGGDPAGDHPKGLGVGATVGALLLMLTCGTLLGVTATWVIRKAGRGREAHQSWPFLPEYPALKGGAGASGWVGGDEEQGSMLPLGVDHGSGGSSASGR